MIPKDEILKYIEEYLFTVLESDEKIDARLMGLMENIKSKPDEEICNILWKFAGIRCNGKNSSSP